MATLFKSLAAMIAEKGAWTLMGVEQCDKSFLISLCIKNAAEALKYGKIFEPSPGCLVEARLKCFIKSWLSLHGW